MKTMPTDLGMLSTSAGVVQRWRRAPVAVGLAIVSAAVVSCGPDSSPESAASSSGTAIETDFDVYLAEVEMGDSVVRVGPLVNVTDRAGYDNQPSFTPDGAGILYTAADESGRTDIMRYDLETGQTAFVTTTYPESEYSATPLPTGDGFSAIRVEADSTQRLWKFDWNGQNPTVVSDIAPAGYHAWFGESHVALFVLGSPPTLVGVNVTNGDQWILEESVGRSIQSIPGRGISWVATGGEEPILMELDPPSGATRPLIATVGEGHDHAWTPDGTLLMADGNQLYWWRVGASFWEPAIMEPFDGTISRLAVSPDGTKLALVGAR